MKSSQPNNHFQTFQGKIIFQNCTNVGLLYQASSSLCQRGQWQVTNHIVNSCPTTKSKRWSTLYSQGIYDDAGEHGKYSTHTMNLVMIELTACCCLVR